MSETESHPKNELADIDPPSLASKLLPAFKRFLTKCRDEGCVVNCRTSIWTLDGKDHRFRLKGTIVRLPPSDVLTREGLIKGLIANEKELLDYLYDSGVQRGSFRAGTNSRAGWERFTYGSLISAPMYHAAIREGYRQCRLAREGHGRVFDPYDIPESELSDLALRIARVASAKSKSFTVVVPLTGLSLAKETSYSLSSEMQLRSWSNLEQCEYMDVVGPLYDANARNETPGIRQFHPFGPPISFLEVTCETDWANESSVAHSDPLSDDILTGSTVVGSPEKIHKAIDSKLSKFHLALAFTTHQTGNVHELWATVDFDIFGSMGKFLVITTAHNRFPRTRYVNGAKTIKLSPCEITSLRGNLGRLDTAMSVFPDDFSDLLRLFDNSNRAEYEVDSNLYAAMALERLFAAESGDISWRFRVFGAALNFEREDATGNLKKIYDQRSHTAHGKTGLKKKKGPKPREALDLLTVAMDRVVTLIVTGRIAPTKSNGKLYPAIEAYLLGLMRDGVRRDVAKSGTPTTGANE